MATMTTTTVSSPIVPSIDKALHLYTYRRMTPAPFYVNHTPRYDVIPASEVQKVDAYNARTSQFTSADVPRHLDLNLGGANRCYWSEDEFKKNKRPHFAASTHSRSAPTSPAHERTAFLEPRDAQYTIDHTASDLAQFLKKTAPASAVMTRSDMEDNGILQRETSVKRGRRMKNTARRVLVSGNKRLPEELQMPCLQPRDSSPVMVQSEFLVEKVSKSGAKYYEINPVTEEITTPDSPSGAVATRDWAHRHRAARPVVSRSGTRSPGHRGNRDRSAHINTDAETDAYGTMSESEGLMFRVPSYQPGTALGEPHYQYIPSRKGSVDSAMALDMARRGSAFSVGSRVADSELTDNEQPRQNSNHYSSSQAAAGPSVRRSMQPRYAKQSPSISSNPSYTQLAEAARRLSRTGSISNTPPPVRRSQEDKFQAQLASFPLTPLNVPSRQPSVNKAKTASAIDARREQARNRKLSHLQQLRQRQASVESTAETVSSDTAQSSSARGEPLMDSDLENVMTQGKTPLPKPIQCPHGFDTCPHGCKYGPSGIELHQHLQPEQVAYRQSLALPATPDLSAHPAYRSRGSSERGGARAPTSSGTSRIDFGSPASTVRPAVSGDNERRLEQKLHDMEQLVRRQEDTINATNAAVQQLSAVLSTLGAISGGANLITPMMQHQSVFPSHQQDTSGVAAAAAAGAIAGYQAHAAEVSRRNSTNSRTRNDSTVSTATTVSEKHTSNGSGYDSSMTSTEAVWGSSGSVSVFETAPPPRTQAMNAHDLYMTKRKCSLTPPVEEDGRESMF